MTQSFCTRQSSLPTFFMIFVSAGCFHAWPVDESGGTESSTQATQDGQTSETGETGETGEAGDSSETSSQYATSCAQLHELEPGVGDGRYPIDLDGTGSSEPIEVWCEMDRGGGGWTLVLVSSDDGQTTWTWNNRSWMGADSTTVGSLDEMTMDFKSAAYNRMVFRDLLFVHSPSDVWAQYDDVSGGNTDLGHFISAIESPNCDPTLAGNGVPLSDGTLLAGVNSLGIELCDTDLYFNLGDHESADMVSCFGQTGWSAAAYGPVWNTGGNGEGCDFADPSSSGLGPAGQCDLCMAETDLGEDIGEGYGRVLELNTGTPANAENRMQVYVR